MAFIEKDESRTAKIMTLSQEEQNVLYTNTFRCPICFKIPAVLLNLDYEALLTVKVTCKCGIKDFEINDFLNIFSSDFRGNLQCEDCKEFATNNYTLYKYCLKCKNFFCGDCQFDHMIKNEHIFISFKDVGSICPIHNLYYQAFCKNCKKDVCKECYNNKKKHDGHRIVNYNSLYISDLEMVDLNKNYGKVQLTVLFKDTETKETIHSLLKDVDELNKNYITELFDANKEKNQSILKFFKFILTIYNGSAHKNYNIIMNVRNNICFNTTTLDIKPDTKLDDNTLLNKFYLYSKNHCIAKKPKPFKEKAEIIDFKKTYVKSEMEDIYQEIIENIDYFMKLFNIKEAELDDNIHVQIQSPFKYKSYIYFGEYTDNMIPHGRGLLIYKNGERYIGNFQNGKKSRYGIYYFKNGAKYKGEWQNNKLNGYGIYYYPNGSIYEGYFKDNKRNGAGILTSLNGDIYKVIWDEGIISCYGVIIYKDGKKYAGYIKDYKKDCCGILTYPNGDVFKGIIFDDFLYFGNFQNKNGNSYIGFYKDNKKSGYGKMKNASIGEVYEGYFHNDKKQGIGRYFYNNGDLYNGYWFDDLRNGFGILKFNNGDWYKGEFVKDIRHGIGIYYEKKGDEYYLGDWVEDNKDGVATVYNQNWYYQGSVKNGIRVGYATFFYDDNIYTGSFKDNMCDGYGTLISPRDTQVYNGKFVKGKIPHKSFLDECEKY